MKAGKTPHSSIISNIASFIIRQRLTVIITIGILTIFMLWQAMGVRIAYDNQKLVPKDDADFIRYERFLNEFGEDGNKLIVGFTQKDLFTKDGLNRYIETTNKVKSIQGIQGIIGIPSAIDIIKDDSIGRFTIKSIVDGKVGSDKEAEEIRNTIVNRPFYKDLIYLENKDIAISAVVINKSYLDNIRRIELIDSVKMYYDAYAKESGVEMHYSGLPFVRHVYSTLVKNELKLFIILAAIVTALLLLLFFRAAPNIIIPLLMVVVSVIWSMGWMGLLDYKMSIISALIPPLMIVIGIPNCIYFINRYHEELKHTGKKFLALHRVMNKVGSATFLTNLTTD